LRPSPFPPWPPVAVFSPVALRGEQGGSIFSWPETPVTAKPKVVERSPLFSFFTARTQDCGKEVLQVRRPPLLLSFPSLHARHRRPPLSRASQRKGGDTDAAALSLVFSLFFFPSPPVDPRDAATLPLISGPGREGTEAGAVFSFLLFLFPLSAAGPSMAFSSGGLRVPGG